MTLLKLRSPFCRLGGMCAFLFLVFGAPLFPGSALEGPDAKKELRVLFVGNSLTYSNDLPSIVESLAKAGGETEFAHKTIAYPDFSLEDHWYKQDARKAIAKGKWDYVVLQQGPSASTEGRALLLEYSRRFAEEIRRAGARPAFYAVWPSASRLQDFRSVGDSYRQAAEAVDGLLFPVGDAWLGAWKIKPDVDLYSTDGFHPSAAGSYLAALVIYQQLYNEPRMKSPFKLRLSSGALIDIPFEQAMLLQRAATEANELSGRR